MQWFRPYKTRFSVCSRHRWQEGRNVIVLPRPPSPLVLPLLYRLPTTFAAGDLSLPPWRQSAPVFDGHSDTENAHLIATSSSSGGTPNAFVLLDARVRGVGWASLCPFLPFEQSDISAKQREANVTTDTPTRPRRDSDLAPLRRSYFRPPAGWLPLQDA